MARSSDNREINLLRDPVFAATRNHGALAHWSLPELLAELLTHNDPVGGFPGLAAEQTSHWHRFLVRCGAKALRVLGREPDDVAGGKSDVLARDIREALARAAGSEGAWDLWKSDTAAPAFLQAPVPEGADLEAAGYRPKPIADLTALIGSKEFERKSEAVRFMAPLGAVYGLIEYQGGVIFGGRGNYETQLTPSRSGKGSGVPFMGVRLPAGLGATTRHDISVLLGRWDHVRQDLGLRGDVWSIWTIPWAGDRPLPAKELDPAFIPMARLVRLGPPGTDGCFETLYFRPSQASRVEDHTQGAVLGDPFTPLVPRPSEEGQFKVRGVMEGGFTYPEVARLLGLGDGDTLPSPTVQAFFDRSGSSSAEGVEVVFDGIAFEQGKTLGYFRRVLPLPTDPKATSLFSRPDPFRRAHRVMLDMIRGVKTTLRAAARIVLHGEARPRGRDEAVVEMAPTLLDDFAEDSDRYFRFLYSAAVRESAGDDGWQTEWAELLSEAGRTAFERVLPGLPAPGAQRLQREMRAVDYLEWKLTGLRGREVAMGTNG